MATKRRGIPVPRGPTLEEELHQAEREAWKHLTRRHFWNFGFYAKKWTVLNEVSGNQNPCPFEPLVELARKKLN